ncbi:hypothetical protein [Chondromyces apiculatus]|uniref:Uncharacterized protein n=1 Tax=Chondromyces apiculatus DSM 436 TaxID=1192034 RepID=A0A017TBU8_9BACT|nr:hypothetical protein [Chondromyces apiculatus]EYF06397.1 Hypothetical protein CAP_1927 [Chondromyces apiculatus DSM 436]
MHWRDIEAAPSVGPWQGLDLQLTAADLPAGAPGLRVKLAYPRRIRVDCAGTPVLWGHVHPQYMGVWRLIGARTEPWEVVPPLSAAATDAITDAISDTIDGAPGSEAWWKAWARNAARTLAASPRTPLYPGSWQITPARAKDVPGLPLPPPARVETFSSTHLSPNALRWARDPEDDPPGLAPAALGGRLAWESWFTTGSNALVRMRDHSPPDAARVRAWAKRARAGTLPPVLTLNVSGLDMYLLLDGHDRLRAALLENAPVGFLIVSAVRSHPRRPDVQRQEALLHELARKRPPTARRPPPSTETENKLVVDAFDTRPWMSHRSRAYPLPGGVEAWEREVAAQPGITREHGIFTGEPPPSESG